MFFLLFSLVFFSVFSLSYSYPAYESSNLCEFIYSRQESGHRFVKKRSSEKAKPRRWTQRKLYLEEYDDEVGDREMYQKESHPRFSMVHKTLPDRGTLKKEMKKSNTAY